MRAAPFLLALLESFMLALSHIFFFFFSFFSFFSFEHFTISTFGGYVFQKVFWIIYLYSCSCMFEIYVGLSYITFYCENF